MRSFISMIRNRGGERVVIPYGVPRHVTQLSSDPGLSSGGGTPPNTAGVDDVYDRNFAPPGGWDEWCSWAITEGVVAAAVLTQAKNMMVGRFTHRDKAIAKKMNEIADSASFQGDLIQGAIHWIGYGRVFYEPVRVLSGITVVGFERLKPIDPWTMKVFWDTPGEVAQLKSFLLRSASFADRAYAGELKSGTGSKVIGYVQNWNRIYGAKPVFFQPQEIIYIPRYPGRRAPEGMSLLRSNYRTIQNKIGIETVQAKSAKRYCDPKPEYTVPKSWWDNPVLDTMKDEIRQLYTVGRQLFLPEGWTSKILEPSGNPVGVIRAQEHIDSQYNAGMGTFDSKSDSTGANRSTADVQFKFFEVELQPDRMIFLNAIRPIIQEWVARAIPEASTEPPGWVFEDLTPDDGISRANVVAPLIVRGLVHKSAVVKYFEDIGYPVPSDEEALEIIQVARSSASSANDPFGIGAGGGGLQNPAGQPPGGYGTQHSQMAATPGIPAGLKPPIKSAQELFHDEIEAMRDDVVSYIGL